MIAFKEPWYDSEPEERSRPYQPRSGADGWLGM